MSVMRPRSILPATAVIFLIMSCGLQEETPAPHFIAVGQSCSVYLSPDGNTWQASESVSGLPTLYAVAYLP